MKARPIVLTGVEVAATLRGEKTQLRRVVDFPHENSLGVWEPTTIGGPDGGRTASGETVPLQGGIWHTRTGDCLICPLGQPGDRLWVREAFRLPSEFDEDSPARVAERCLDAGYRQAWAPIQYEADATTRDWKRVGTQPARDVAAGRLRQAQHMPIWASRITIEIAAVRVERLQSICNSETDARAECAPIEEHHSRGYCCGEFLPPTIRAFRDAWDAEKAAPGHAWDANPWVWVIVFRRFARAALPR